MTTYSIIWDLETVVDCEAFKRMESLLELSDDEAREQHGDKFAKLPLHQIVCIGALVAQRDAEGFRVIALGAPHTGQRSERDIIEAFVGRIGELRPQLVSFNGHGFDRLNAGDRLNQKGLILRAPIEFFVQARTNGRRDGD